MMESHPLAPDEDLFYQRLIRSYVTSPRFVERAWLAQRVDALLAEPECRFVLLIGEPGSGKTALAAWLASLHPDWPRYFIRRDSQAPLSSGDARSFLLTVGHQLAARRPHLFRPDRLEIVVRQWVGELESGGQVAGIRLQDLAVSPFYRTTLLVEQHVQVVAGHLEGLSVQRVVAHERFLELGNLAHLALLDPARLLLSDDPQARIVILVDALDEQAHNRGGDSVLDWLAACPELPPNVRLVLTSRSDDALAGLQSRQRPWLRQIEMGAERGAVRDDLCRCAAEFAGQPPVVAALVRHQIDAAGFVGRAAGRADGNFQYLAALLRALEQALAAGAEEQVGRLLRLEEVPTRLEALYAFFLGQIRHDVAGQAVEVRGSSFEQWLHLPAWEGMYQPILGVLSVAKTPPTAEQIRAFGHIPAAERWLPGALERLGQFLDHLGDGYRLYHATLPEFITAPRTRQAYPACYLDPLEWHQKIVAHLLTLRGDDWDECDDEYALSYIVQHILDGGLYDLLDAFFTDGFINARLKQAGWHMPLVEDLERAEAVLSPERAIRLCLKVIHGRQPNSLVTQKVLRRLALLRPRLGGQPICGQHPRLDPYVDQAVAALGLAPDEAVAALRDLSARVKNKRVLGIIALALGETGSLAAIPVLVDLLQHAPYSVRWTAADGLIALNDRGLIPWLMSWFSEAARVSDRQRALYILGRMQAEEARALVPLALQSPDVRIMAAAADLIWLLAPVENSEALLWDKLGFRRDGPDTPPLWTDAWLQKRLVTALGRTGSRAAIPHLARLAAEVDARPEPKTATGRRARRELQQSITRALEDLEKRHPPAFLVPEGTG